MTPSLWFRFLESKLGLFTVLTYSLTQYRLEVCTFIIESSGMSVPRQRGKVWSHCLTLASPSNEDYVFKNRCCPALHTKAYALNWVPRVLHWAVWIFAMLMYINFGDFIQQTFFGLGIPSSKRGHPSTLKRIFILVWDELIINNFV